MSIDLAKCFLEYTEIAEAMTLAKLQVFCQLGLVVPYTWITCRAHLLSTVPYGPGQETVT